jgi:hypothetical protein
MNARKKGLQRVHEVRRILEGLGHVCEGIHRDYFSIADLISYSPDDKEFILHQVTDLKNKAIHIKMIQDSELPAWVWCRLEGRVGYRVFFVTQDKVEEGEAVFKQ